MDHGPTTLGFEATRRRLDLTRWQLNVAVNAGLLSRNAKGDFSTALVEAALADGERFRARVVAEDEVVASEAARQLGLSLPHFRAAANAGVINPTRSLPWTYGTVRLYRRQELDRYRDQIVAWLAARPRPTPDPRAAARRRYADQRTRARKRRLRFLLDRPAGPLEAAAGLLQLLDRYQRSLLLSAHRSGSTRTARRLRAEAGRVARAISCGLELLAGLPDPAIGRRVSVLLVGTRCRSCGRDEERRLGDGCRRCRIDAASYTLEISVARERASTLRFSVAYDVWATWTALRPRRAIARPSPFVMSTAQGTYQEPGRWSTVSASLRSAPDWLTIGAEAQRARVRAFREQIRARQAAGDAPTERLPGWLAVWPQGDYHQIDYPRPMSLGMRRAFSTTDPLGRLAERLTELAGRPVDFSPDLVSPGSPDSA